MHPDSHSLGACCRLICHACPYSVTLIYDVQPIDQRQIETLVRQFRHGNMLKVDLTIRFIEEIAVVIVHRIYSR